MSLSGYFLVDILAFSIPPTVGELFPPGPEPLINFSMKGTLIHSQHAAEVEKKQNETETKKCMGSLIQYGNVIQVRDRLSVRMYTFSKARVLQDSKIQFCTKLEKHSLQTLFPFHDINHHDMLVDCTPMKSQRCRWKPIQPCNHRVFYSPVRAFPFAKANRLFAVVNAAVNKAVSDCSCST